MKKEKIYVPYHDFKKAMAALGRAEAIKAYAEKESYINANIILEMLGIEGVENEQA